MPITSYQDYRMKKEDLMQILHSAAIEIDSLKGIGLKLDARVLVDLHSKLKQDNFKVLVIGEFKNGKSTFINALMGEKILPAYSTPCTAVINEVVYGKDKSAMLYFKNPLPKEISPDIAEKAKQHIRQYQDAEEIPPYEIDVSDLEDYVAIPDPTKDQAESIQELPYSKVVLKYPVDLCRDGVEIIDSPGLNENETRTKVTAGYLSQADAILFVFRCPKICSKNEIAYIEEQIRTQGHEDIFFVCNAINQVPEDERANLMKFGTKKLLPLTALGEHGIFYVNALGALEARRDHDEEQLSTTGMPELESSLSEYLRNNRGKAKLLSVITPCSGFINTTCIPQAEGYINSLLQGLEEFEKKVKAAMPALDLARSREKLIKEKIDLAIDRLRQSVREKIAGQYDLIVADLPTYVESLDLDNRMSINIFKHKSQQEALSKELTEKISQHIQSEMSKWIRADLTPYLEHFVDQLESDIGQDIDVFYDGIDSFRYDVSGTPKVKNIGGLDRVGGAIVGTITCGPLYGLVGAEMGLGETLKRSAVTFGATFAGAFLLAFTPLGIASITTLLVGTILTSGGVQFLSAGKELTKKFKRKFTESFKQQLVAERDKSCEAYAKNLTAKVQENLELIPQALHKEVEIEESKIEALRADMRDNEKECKEKSQKMEEIKARLESVQQSLSEMKNAIE